MSHKFACRRFAGRYALPLAGSIILALSPLASAAAAWYNEPNYINPGSEGLLLGLTPLAYKETNSNKFLGQYVCVDSNDQPIPQDPLVCTTSRRKLKIGEDLPYIRYSKTASGKIASMSDSFPLVFNDRFRFINTRHSGSSSRIPRNYMTGDGYDITDDYNGYGFIYGTRDPKTTAEDYIWCGEFGNLGGGWMLWPDHLNAGDDIFSIGGGNYGSCSPGGSTYTSWDAPAWLQFTSGKTLYSTKTYHFSNASASSSDALEVFYQNSLYGAVRWEAWKSTPQTDSKACNGSPTMVVDGRTFYRSMCHDWTNLQFQQTPYHAYHNPLNTIFTTSPQLLKNSDFVKGTESWAVESSQTPNTLTMAASTEPSGNPYLTLQKSGTGVVSLSQSFAGFGGSTYAQPVLQGGVLLKGPVGAEGVIGIVLSSAKGPTEERKLRFTFKNGDWTAIRFHAESAHLTDAKATVKFKFYPKMNGTYAVDEAFVAVLPKTMN